MALKAVVHRFQAHQKSQGMKQIKCRNEVISCVPPLESLMKKPGIELQDKY